MSHAQPLTAKGAALLLTSSDTPHQSILHFSSGLTVSGDGVRSHREQSTRLPPADTSVMSVPVDGASHSTLLVSQRLLEQLPELREVVWLLVYQFIIAFQAWPAGRKTEAWGRGQALPCPL